MFGNLFRHQKRGRINHLIWMATMWSVSNLRNQVIFNGAIPIGSTILEDINLWRTMVSDVLAGGQDFWVWPFSWRRNLF
jgi:hypothetical protein